jgi:hypothetical protein
MTTTFQMRALVLGHAAASPELLPGYRIPPSARGTSYKSRAYHLFAQSIFVATTKPLKSRVLYVSSFLYTDLARPSLAGFFFVPFQRFLLPLSFAGIFKPMHLEAYPHPRFFRCVDATKPPVRDGKKP